MEKERINILINDINNLSSGYERDLVIAKFKSNITYMLYTNNISVLEYNTFLNKIERNDRDIKIDKFDKIKIKNFLKYNNVLMNCYEEILNLYLKYDLDYVSNYCNYLNMSYGMISFFKYINIYDLFKRLLSNHMISKNTSLKDTNLTINNYDDSYIVIGDFSKNNLMYYNFFVHEMGHVYENNVLKDKRLYNPISLYGEIIPITFERIFVDYLKSNKLISESELKKLIINMEANRSFEVGWSYETCDIIKNKKYILDDLNVITIPDQNSKYHTLSNHYYTIGNIVSIYLLNEYKKDNELFIKNLPNIVLELSNLSIKDVINRYYNIDLFNNYLKNNLAKKIKCKIR